MIDETSACDSDYISVSDSGGSDEAITFTLSNVADPESASDHSVVVRASDDSGMGVVNLNVNLKDGSTSIKNEDFSLSGSATNKTMTLNATQANNIGDYNDLNLVITATDQMGMGTTTKVYHAYFTCPDEGGSGPLPGAMNTYKQMRND